jgi:hypothetical protein
VLNRRLASHVSCPSSLLWGFCPSCDEVDNECCISWNIYRVGHRKCAELSTFLEDATKRHATSGKQIGLTIGYLLHQLDFLSFTIKSILLIVFFSHM